MTTHKQKNKSDNVIFSFCKTIDISIDIDRYIGRFVLKLGFISHAAFLVDFFHMEMSEISVIYRYIVNIGRFFPIFPLNDFRLQKSCRKGPTPEISTIYRDIYVLGPVWVITAAPFWSIQYKITVSYNDSTFRYIQFIPVSTSWNMQTRHKMR